MILVSSCLLGIRTKYDGSCNLNTRLIELCPSGLIVPACPEQLGGLPTPRPPAEIKGGSGADVLRGIAKVYTNQGDDITEQFIAGAQETLLLCKRFQAKAAILKERSSSCGRNLIYDGTFQGAQIRGQGVTAAMLASEGIRVCSDEELTDELLLVLFGGAK